MVKRRAAILSVAPIDLPIEEHRVIDEGTRQKCLQATDLLVVEGIFLDQVLRGVFKVRFVRLECNETEREARFTLRRAEQRVMAGGIRRRDEEDGRLREMLYGSDASWVTNWLVLDSGVATVDELTSAIWNKIGAAAHD
jgi:hypothetical protein